MQNKVERHNKRITCNLCGGPREVTFTEEDSSTGKIVQKKHIVPCLGHPHIHPSLWNGSTAAINPESQAFIRVVTFDDYKKTEVKRRAKQAAEGAGNAT